MGDDWLDGLDFEAIETAVQQTALRVAAKAVAHRLNADHSDHQGLRQPCPCGRQAGYAGRRSKTFTTALGEMERERAWYHCPYCHTGFSPRDCALDLDGASLSPAALRMTAVSAARVSFAEASDLLRELACLHIHPTQVERCAKALGQSIAQDEREVTELEPPQAPTLYLGLDGTGVPMRKAETQGRKGKQSDGSAKTREAKLCVIWSAESRDKHGLPLRDPDSVSCNAAIESIATRLKRGGMHWTLPGANAIIALRCAILSNCFDDFWERRAAASL